MELLINKSKVAEVLQVAIGYDSKEFDVFIREAQDFDLKPLLCEDFYYDLVKKKADAPFLELIDGANYQYNERDYFHRGLGDVLAYFTYARFMLKSNNVSTSHGIVTKKTPHSEPITIAEKRNFYYKYKKDANLIFEDVKKFVERNIDTFDSWNNCNDCGQSTNKNSSSFKTTVIQ